MHDAGEGLCHGRRLPLAEPVARAAKVRHEAVDHAAEPCGDARGKPRVLPAHAIQEADALLHVLHPVGKHLLDDVRIGQAGPPDFLAVGVHLLLRDVFRALDVAHHLAVKSGVVRPHVVERFVPEHLRQAHLRPAVEERHAARMEAVQARIAVHPYDRRPHLLAERGKVPLLCRQVVRLQELRRREHLAQLCALALCRELFQDLDCLIVENDEASTILPSIVGDAFDAVCIERLRCVPIRFVRRCKGPVKVSSRPILHGVFIVEVCFCGAFASLLSVFAFPIPYAPEKRFKLACGQGSHHAAQALQYFRRLLANRLLLVEHCILIRDFYVIHRSRWFYQNVYLIRV